MASPARLRVVVVLATLLSLASLELDAEAQVELSRDPMTIWMLTGDGTTDLSWRGPTGEEAHFRCAGVLCIADDWFFGAGRYELHLPAQGTWPALTETIQLRSRDVAITIHRSRSTGGIGLRVGSEPRGLRAIRNPYYWGWMLENRSGHPAPAWLSSWRVIGRVEEWRNGVWIPVGCSDCGYGMPPFIHGAVPDGGALTIHVDDIEDAPTDGRSWRVIVLFNQSFVGTFTRYDRITIDGAVWRSP